MEIEKIGSYFDLDQNGFILNPASQDKFQEHWKCVVEAVKQSYLIKFGDKVVSIYIRGSVAKGEAIDGVSDIDSFCILDLKENEIDWSWSKEAAQNIEAQFPFIQKAEIGTIPIDEALTSNPDKIMIKTQSVCIYGQDLADQISPMKPGKDIVQHLSGISDEVERTISWLSEPHEPHKVLNKCSWIMKRLLRSGLELVSERANKYTRDLYPCFETFSEFYPEKEKEMRKILELAIKPSDDRSLIKEILETTGKWLTKQIPEKF